MGGSVTFLIATDDDAELHLAREANSTTDLEQLIDSNIDWVKFRDWTPLLVSKGDNSDPQRRLRTHRGRTSRKVELALGEQRYLEAFYTSGGGGDHLSVGAIFHTATVNRKDRPTAIDDAQLISLEHHNLIDGEARNLIQLEVANITLAGQAMQVLSEASSSLLLSRLELSDTKVYEP